MLNGSPLPEKPWAESVATAVYIQNRLPNSKNLVKTPYETRFGQKPTVKHLRIFGQLAVVNKPSHQRDGKWDHTGTKMFFVGYTQLLNTYRFYDENLDRIITSCNVTFLNEQASGGSKEVSVDESIPVT